MAIIAGITTRDMRWMFARCDDAVMTAQASADYLGVINGEDRRKNVGVVAVLADIAGLNVCQVFADGIDIVMAVNTLANDIQMVKVGRQPTYR